MEHLFDYLKTSNPMHDILYFVLFCALIFFFLFIVIIAKKNGVSFNFFGFFKSEGDKKEASHKIEQAAKKLEEKENGTNTTMQDFEKILTRINFRLDNTEKEQIKVLEEEKKTIELELNKYRNETEKNVKTIEGLKSENEMLNKKLNALNNEIKVLKLDKHPDILTFDKVLYQLNVSLYELYTEILVKDHISKYKNDNEFEAYMKNRINIIFPYIKKHIEKNYTNGILVKSINEVFTTDTNSIYKNIYKNIELGFREIKKISTQYHKLTQIQYKENLNKLETSINNYYKNLSQEIKKNVTEIQKSTTEEITKTFLKKDFLFDLIIDNELNSIETNINIRNEMKENGKNICIETIDSVIKTLESYFKNKVVKIALMRIKNQKGE